MLHKRMDDIHYDNPQAYDSHFIPPEFASSFHGVLWWRSQVSQHTAEREAVEVEVEVEVEEHESRRGGSGIGGRAFVNRREEEDEEESRRTARANGLHS